MPHGKRLTLEGAAGSSSLANYPIQKRITGDVQTSSNVIAEEAVATFGVILDETRAVEQDPSGRYLRVRSCDLFSVISLGHILYWTQGSATPLSQTLQKRRPPVLVAPSENCCPEWLRMLEANLCLTSLCPQYPILLGKGACKRVYKGFDCETGQVIAWNLVRNGEATEY